MAKISLASKWSGNNKREDYSLALPVSHHPASRALQIQSPQSPPIELKEGGSNGAPKDLATS